MLLLEGPRQQRRATGRFYPINGSKTKNDGANHRHFKNQEITEIIRNFVDDEKGVQLFACIVNLKVETD